MLYISNKIIIFYHFTISVSVSVLSFHEVMLVNRSIVTISKFQCPCHSCCCFIISCSYSVVLSSEVEIILFIFRKKYYVPVPEL